MNSPFLQATAETAGRLGGVLDSRTKVARFIRQQAELLDRHLVGEPLADCLHVHESLRDLAALCVKAAQDLGIESSGDAVGKDIPF